MFSIRQMATLLGIGLVVACFRSNLFLLNRVSLLQYNEISYNDGIQSGVEELTRDKEKTETQVSTNHQTTRVFLVGCPHSGTSLLLRTVAQLPGVHCAVDHESKLFLNRGRKISKISKILNDWDTETTMRGFSAWVEKTPLHILHVERIFEVSSNAKVLFIVRDARAVANSLSERGIPPLDSFEGGLNRWVSVNLAIRPFLNDHLYNSSIMTVRYEDFTNPTSTMQVLSDIYSFLGSPGGSAVDNERLALSLTPLEHLRAKPVKICEQFSSENDKQMALRRIKANSTLVQKGGDARLPGWENHRKHRSNQMGKAIHAADQSLTNTYLTEVNTAIFHRNKDAIELMDLFHYNSYNGIPSS